MRIALQLMESSLLQKVPAIAIQLRGQRYMVNVPQNIQRFLAEHKHRMHKNTNIMFTKTNSASISGLMSLMMMISQQGKASGTRVFGNPKLIKYLDQFRNANRPKIQPFTFYLWNIQKLGSSSNEALKLAPPSVQSIVQKEGGTLQFKHCQVIPLLFKEVCSYIYIAKQQKGSVCPQKLKAFKIQQTNIRRLLQQGKLQLPDGSWVFQEDFRLPKTPAPVFFILHHDSLQTLNHLRQHPKLMQVLNSEQYLVESVVHIFQNPEIVRDAQFRQFVDMFCKQTHHIFYGGIKPQNSLNSHFRHLSLTKQLNKHFPTFFPDIQQNQLHSYTKYFASYPLISQLFPSQLYLMHSYTRGFQMTIFPKKAYTPIQGQQKTISLNLLQETYKTPFFPQQLANSQQCVWNFKECDPEVVFLGTASMKPCAHRNVSGILVRFSPSFGVLLDCGQGTFYQLQNHFGADASEEVLVSLQVIFITHLHADHNLGIFNLLTRRWQLCQKRGLNSPCFLIVPHNLAPQIQAFQANIQQLGLSTSQGNIFVQPRYSKVNKNMNTASYKYKYAEHSSDRNIAFIEFQNLLQEAGISKFQLIRVIHCPQSYGVVMQHLSGMKISYSGDTRPCKDFIRLARNSTLMIHEATFDDSLAESAREARHSTVKEAVQSGLESGSWRLALTHFGNRGGSPKLQPSSYQDFSKLKEYAISNTFMCFDHLRFKLSQSELLPQVSRHITKELQSAKGQADE